MAHMVDVVMLMLSPHELALVGALAEHALESERPDSDHAETLRGLVDAIKGCPSCGTLSIKDRPYEEYPLGGGIPGDEVPTR